MKYLRGIAEMVNRRGNGPRAMRYFNTERWKEVIPLDTLEREDVCSSNVNRVYGCNVWVAECKC